MNPALQIDLMQKVTAENDLLRERVAVLEAQLSGGNLMTPIEWQLTTSEEIVFGALVAREMATKEFIMHLLYRGLHQDEAEIKIVDVFVCKMRRKLNPFGIKIETRWGRGYSLEASARARFQRQRNNETMALTKRSIT